MKQISTALILSGVIAGSALASEQDDFLLQTGQDLVAVCSEPAESPMYAAAIHFCHGYLTGLGQYDRVIRADPAFEPIFCPKDPRPTRNEVIAGYVEWAEKNPATLSEPAIDSIFRYAVETWPCPASS